MCTTCTPRWIRPLIGCVLLSAMLLPPTAAAADQCRGEERTFRLARITEADVLLRGPAELIFDEINRLRYDVEVGQEITVSDGPDLSAVPIFPTLGEVDTEEPAEEDADSAQIAEDDGGIEPAMADPGLSSEELKTVEEIEEKFSTIERTMPGLSTETAKLNQQAKNAQRALLSCSARFDNLVDDSDTLIRNGGSRALAGEIPEVLRCIRKKHRDLQWPDAASIGSVRDRIKKQEDKLNKLHFIQGFALWYNNETPHAKRYDEVRARIASLLTALAAIGPDSDAAKAFEQGREALGERERLLQSLVNERDPAEPFRLTHCVPCGFPRFRSKDVDVTVTYTERFPADGKDPKVMKREVVTVTCPSRFAVATGLGVAFVEDKSFKLVDSLPDAEATAAQEGNGDGNGDGPLVKRIDVDTASDPGITAIAVIHTELVSWVDELGVGDDRNGEKRRGFVTGLHFTAGASLQIDGGAETPIGYLAGLSLSLQDRLFLTAGWQFHRVTSLAGGFEEGQQVPDELAAPPTTTEWDSGPALTVTYRPRS